MTINTTGSENAWQRQCLIEVTDGTSTMAMEAMTETVDIDTGERDLDNIGVLNLGQIPKHGIIGITTVTFEGYARQSGSPATGTGTGFWDIFANKPVVDASQPLSIALSNTLTRYRVSILWTDDAAATTGGGATATSTNGRRFVIGDCFCVSCKEDYTDGILKETLSFKGIAFNTAGTSNIKMESGLATVITALGTYVPGTTGY